MSEVDPEDDIYVFDLSKMYPNIIRTMEISPEQVREEPNEHTISIDFGEMGTLYLSHKEKGFLPRKLEKMFKMRERIEDEMEKYDVDSEEYKILSRRVSAIKRVINSIYGMLTYYKSRYFLPKVVPNADLLGRSVTKVGRKLIKWSKRRAEELGYEVIYIDTDSIFVRGIKSVEEAYQLQEMLNNSYDQFAQQWDLDEHYFLIEFEKIYDTLLVKKDAKKRYVGMIKWKDGEFYEEMELDVTGFEIVRSDTPEWTVNFQREHFKKVLNGISEKEMFEWCCEQIDDIESGEIDWWEIAVPSGIGQPLDEYDKSYPHVEGSKYSNEHLGTNFSEGDKPRYVYIDSTPEGYPPTDVICLEKDTEIPDGFELDMERMTQRLMISKLDTVDKTLGWDLEQDLVLYMQDQAKLTDFDPNMFGDEEAGIRIGDEVQMPNGKIDIVEDVFPEDNLLETRENGYLTYDDVEVKA